MPLKIDEVLSRLEKVKQSGAGQWYARCPAHDDKNPSLSITQVGDRILLKCHRGCTFPEIKAALGLNSSPNIKKNGNEPEAVYQYLDEKGNLVYEIVRFPSKQFRGRVREGADYKYSLNGVRRVLYRLPELLESDKNEYVFYTEGEKDCDRVRSLGLTATTHALGAKNWKDEYGKSLLDRVVVLLPDCDDAGREMAEKVAESLQGKAASIRVLELPNLLEHGDVSDWLDAGGTKSGLLQLVEKTPVFNLHSPLFDGPPVPLGNITVKPMTEQILPYWLGEMAEAVTHATETPRELSVGVSLGMAAAVCQGKFSVMVNHGHFEPLALWIATVLPSGSRKTAVIKALSHPLIEWEKVEYERLIPEIRKAESLTKSHQKRAEKLRKEILQADGAEMDQLVADLAKFEANPPEIPVQPRLFCQDTTPEKLGVLLAEHNERMALISDEGGLFDTLAGRYSNRIPNLDLFLQSHCGMFVRVDRGSRPSLKLNHPLLTIVLSPQPEMLEGLISNKTFRGRGLLARFLFMIPKSNLGFRKLESIPVPNYTAKQYHDCMVGLIKKQPGNKNGKPVPYVLKLSDDASAMYQDYARHIENQMKPGEKFSFMTDWAGKQPGTLARIAGVFHCVKHSQDYPEKYLIDANTTGYALALCYRLEDHAVAAFSDMGANEVLITARKILDWIERKNITEFTRRDCYRSLRRGYQKPEDLIPGYDLLAETGHLVRIEKSSDNIGGRPCTRYIVYRDGA